MAYQPQPIIPPFLGVVDNIPSIFANPNSMSVVDGFLVEKQRIRSVPKRSALPLPPAPAGTILSYRSFMDVLGNIHTVVICANITYYYVNGVYTAITGAAITPSLLPPRVEVYQNLLIYTQATQPPVTISGNASSGVITLPSAGTCFFLGKIASRMLYLNLLEPGPSDPATSHYPRRFRWSKVNDANDFVDFSSGVAEVPEVEDSITGYATQGALGYIYRNSGITTITPTGSSSPAFYLENYTGGAVGTGNFYAYSLAQYGNLTCFASEEDINAFNPLYGPPQPIGGSASRSIYTDLSSKTGQPIGGFLPSLGWERQGLQYWLAIPLVDNTSAVWMYQFESKTWTRQFYPFNVTCINLAAVD